MATPLNSASTFDEVIFLDPMLVDFGWLIGSYLFGIMLGCLTGLIPGFHVNNVALILSLIHI